MNLLPASTRMMQRLGALLVLSGVLFAAALFSAHATSAARDGSTEQHFQDKPALYERSVLPRIAIVRTALTPQPNRPKYLGGFKDKAHPGAEPGSAPESAPFFPLSRQAPNPASRLCSWAWFSRAPPTAA